MHFFGRGGGWDVSEFNKESKGHGGTGLISAVGGGEGRGVTEC